MLVDGPGHVCWCPIAAPGPQAPQSTDGLSHGQRDRQRVAGGEPDPDDLLAEFAKNVATGKRPEHRLAVESERIARLAQRLVRRHAFIEERPRAGPDHCPPNAPQPDPPVPRMSEIAEAFALRTANGKRQRSSERNERAVAQFIPRHVHEIHGSWTRLRSGARTVDSSSSRYSTL